MPGSVHCIGGGGSESPRRTRERGLACSSCGRLIILVGVGSVARTTAVAAQCGRRPPRAGDPLASPTRMLPKDGPACLTPAAQASDPSASETPAARAPCPTATAAASGPAAQPASPAPKSNAGAGGRHTIIALRKAALAAALGPGAEHHLLGLLGVGWRGSSVRRISCSATGCADPVHYCLGKFARNKEGPASPRAARGWRQRRR